MSQIGDTSRSSVGGVDQPYYIGNGSYTNIRTVDGHGLERFGEGDLFNRDRATVLLVFSIVGLIGNSMVILLSITLTKLQKTQNAFLLHHSILDTIKSAYCIVFSKSLFNLEPPAECAILSASYIVFVTTTAFNILGITVNELYHFTNNIIGVKLSNKCCVCFGLGITWIASIVINLGIAFLPGNPTYDNKIGYCTFMYGVTGNYLLHVLWIGLITLAMIMCSVYLRKFHKDIKGRAYYRLATLFYNTLHIQLDEENPTAKISLHKKNVHRLIAEGERSFVLCASMMTVFSVFWYPLFILTLVDPHFRINPVYYKTLTVIAWCHSSFTPILFLLFNLSMLKGVPSRWHQEMLRQPSIKDEQHDECSILTSRLSPTRIAQRPQTLDVIPVYKCETHQASGVCQPLKNNFTTEQSKLFKRSAAHNQPSLQCIGRQNSIMKQGPQSQYERWSTTKNSKGLSVMRSLSTSDLTSDIDSDVCKLSKEYKAMQSKYDKMGLAAEKRYLQQQLPDLSYQAKREPDWRQLYKLHQPQDRKSQYRHPNTRTNHVDELTENSTQGSLEYEIDYDELLYPHKLQLVKDVTVPNYTLVKDSDSYRQLNVHRLSTGCLISNCRNPMNPMKSDFNQTNTVKWV